MMAGDAPKKGATSAGRAVVWQFASKYTTVAVQLVVTMVLARLITPEQYGVVAVVTVFSTLFSTLADVGIGPAVIQYDLDEDESSGLFVFTAIFGVALAGIFCAFAPLIASVYAEPLLVPLCCLTSLSIVFNSANMVPNGLLLKRKQFRLISVRLIVSSVVSGVVSIALALWGFGCYALVLNTVFSALFVLCWNLLGSSLRVTNLHFLAPLRKVLRYSLFQAAFSTVNYFARNLDNLLTGKFFGTETLGYYDKAYRLSVFPNTYLSGVIATVLQPYLVEHKGDRDYIYDKYLDVARTLALVGAWVSCMFALCSTELVYVFYGPQWTETGALLRLLSLSVMFQMINSVAGAIFQTLEHTDYMFYSSLINTAVMVVGIVVGIAGGSVSVLAAGVAVAYALQTITNTYFLVVRSFGQSARTYASHFVVELLVVAAGFAVSMTVGSTVLWGNYAVSLVVKGVTGTLLVLAAYLVTGRWETVKRMRGYLRG